MSNPVHHFIVSDPEGKIVSKLRTINVHGTSLIFCAGGTYSLACGHTGTSAKHMATDCPWVVDCPACKKTSVFKKLDRPKPGQEHENIEVSDDVKA